MRVAVAAEGPDTTSPISSRAGRAPYYLIFENGKLIEVLKNPYADAPAAGVQAAALLAERGITHFVASDVGPSMERALSLSHIKIVLKRGLVEEAIKTL